MLNYMRIEILADQLNKALEDLKNKKDKEKYYIEYAPKDLPESIVNPVFIFIRIRCVIENTNTLFKIATVYNSNESPISTFNDSKDILRYAMNMVIFHHKDDNLDTHPSTLGYLYNIPTENPEELGFWLREKI